MSASSTLRLPLLTPHDVDAPARTNLFYSWGGNEAFFGGLSSLGNAKSPCLENLFCTVQVAHTQCIDYTRLMYMALEEWRYNNKTHLACL